MNNFIFNNPTKIIFGRNTIIQIGEELKKLGIYKVLFLYGGNSIKNNGTYEQVRNSLINHNIEFIEHSGVQPNPILTHTEIGIDLCKENGVTAILAVGGGSVIDEAKAIAAGAYLPNLWDAYAGKVKVTQALPIFTILTISGTGSEMNGSSVLTNSETEQKWFISAHCLFPKISIINPSVMRTLPWNQTVNGGIDAISHTLENYVMGKDQEISISIQESIIKSIISALDNLQIDNNNYESRASLAWASTIALNGIAGAGMGGGDWAVHRIEHALSAIRPDIAHGTGLAIIFPAYLKFVYEFNKVHLDRFAKNVWNCDSFEEAIETMKAKYKSWGSAISLSELNIEENQFSAIAKKALEQTEIGKLKNLSNEDVIEILKIAF